MPQAVQLDLKAKISDLPKIFQLIYLEQSNENIVVQAQISKVSFLEVIF